MDMTELKSKANGLLAKLPFRAWAENIPAGARAKVPLLEKAIPFANQIAAGLAAVLVVTVIACSGGGKKEGVGAYYTVDMPDRVLNIRSEPDASRDNKITQLADGEQVKLLETGKMDTMEGITAPWFKVRSDDGATGWAFSGFLVASESPKGKVKKLQAAAREAAEKGRNLEAEGFLEQAEKLTAEIARGAKKEQEKTQPAAQKSAALAPESDFNVILNDDGDGAVIMGYTGPGGNIIIPATIQGMPVVSVFMNPPRRKVSTGEYITFSARDIRSIDDVERVGTTEKTIDANTSLISVVIPEGVGWVGGFQDCIALRSVTLPDSVTEIRRSTFSGCTSLVSINIPGSVKEIGFYAFMGCTSLASITIPDSVTEISRSTFSGCTSLASLTIPEGVTRIGTYAFQGCTSLASIAIPDSVTEIESWAFSGCASLAAVTISPIKREWIHDVFENCPKLSLASQAALKAAGYTDGY